MFEGAYPPGVNGRMIDEYFGDCEPDRCCDNCRYYEERTCGMICSLAEAAWCDEHTVADLDSMSDDEYIKLFVKDKEDTCEDHIFWED